MKTQNEKIHDLLKKGPVTAMDALNHAGSFRLAARIFDLKADGIQIETRNKKVNGKVIAEYRLS